MSYITEESIEHIVKSIFFYYKETKNRLPTKREFQEIYIDAYNDLLVFGCANIPREPEEIEPTITDLLREMHKDPLIQRVIEAKAELINNSDSKKKKLSRKKRRK